MALTMLDKAAEKKDKAQWPAEIEAEFEREAKNPNPCVGTQLLSETEQARLDHPPRARRADRLPPPRARLFLDLGERRARPPARDDGTTVEHTYYPGETRHETYGKGEYKVHDLENLGDKEMVFMTIEFMDSANKPMPVPERVRPQAAA